MEDYKYLMEIERIASNNLFIHYIVDRVCSDDYRGVQCSQHNRLTYNYFLTVINSIYNVAGDNIFNIHIGDDKGVRQLEAELYYKVVDEIKYRIGKGTINSIKKNTFPDIARMGFLNRYNKYDEKISEINSRETVYSVGLSDLGIKFINAETFQKIKLFTDGIDILTKNTASELAELLYLNDYGIDNIDILEFMYIISDKRREISTDDKFRLLLDYRRLSEQEKDHVDNCLKAFCNPKNRKRFANKTLLRDYSNWKNESQQIYGLLANSTYFKVENNKLILNTGNYGLFDNQVKRREKAKKEYFKQHKINKKAHYELHHIIPFSKAQNKSDVAFVDDYKNLIYLNETKHFEFTGAGSKNVVLRYTNNSDNIVFMDFNDSIIIVDTKKDALINYELLPEIKRYNEQLIKKFYYSDNI